MAETGAAQCAPGARMWLRATWLGTLLLTWAAPLGGQQPLAVPAPAPLSRDSVLGSPRTIRWYHAAAVIAGTSLLFIADGPVERFAQSHRSPSTDGAASVFRRFGQPEVYGTVSLGLVAAGLASGDDHLTRAGARAAFSVGLTGGATFLLKGVLGRERPEAGEGALDFDPFFPRTQGLPSGHAAAAFALATSLADDIHRPWATVGLYALATGAGLSRINDDRHWLSDVALGAVVGVASAKLVSGRWRIFGLRTPSFLATPTGGAGLGWQASF
ncbi:MAG TPA: phosphatase PAP2 family protein [Gemmatimonadales bacterium]|nr:phosphatase PAP2 family protein [Gemmatimonadales bacterium]